MPWSGKSFSKHNGKLNGREASKAATIANAVLQKSGDEGMAIAVANKKLNDMRRRGRISDKAAAKAGMGTPPAPMNDVSNPPRDVDAATR